MQAALVVAELHSPYNFHDLNSSLKYIIIVLVLLTGTTAFAQNKKAKSKATTTTAPAVAKEKKEDNLNNTDAQNRKQGMWFNEVAALRGEPAYKEFGSYLDNQKTGLWYKLNGDGGLVAIENFRRGVLNGEVQYYSKGRLSCIGHYRGLNPDNKLDSIWVKDPETLLDTMVVVSSDIGTMKHGTWRYYDPISGRLTREEEYQVDDLIKSQDFEFTSKADSAYIEQRKAMLPHNTAPKGKAPKRKAQRYTY